ncbi:MAG: helix-turn-helix domain-containing protein [Aggregatilineales bacterium]
MKAKDSFGNWLRQRRKALDLTQFDLADQVGCSVVTIRKIEGDERRPSKQITERLADVLAISEGERSEFVTFARYTDAIPPAPPLRSAAATTAHNLPMQPTSFIGRADELAQIAERLDDPACRLLTLVGAGGIGKTRLALQAAADQPGNFANGVYFVSLTGVGSPNLVASAIAGALQTTYFGPEDLDVQIVNYLRHKALLLVLDNFEHLLEATDLLTHILAAAPAVKILATSRERLNLQEEWVITLEGLSFPSALDRTRRSASLQNNAIDVGTPFLASEFEDYSAVQLFVQRARQIQAGFSLEQNAESVLSICRYVEGMPLGIELAASWLRGMSCPQIATRMEQNPDFLVTRARNVPERHSSLRAVFEQSWRLLSNVEQNVLAALSVFRGGFDLEAAEQVAGASPSVLARLADKSLIRLNPFGRYDLHERLRQFAADKLAEAGETAAVARCHLDYFVRLAEQAETQQYGPQEAMWYDRLEMEYDNLNAALDWSLTDDQVEAGLRLVGALGYYWDPRAYRRARRTRIEQLLAKGNDAPAAIRAKALRVAASIATETADYEYVRLYCEESLHLARSVGDKAGIAWALSDLAHYLKLNLDIRQAYVEQALVQFREIGDGFGISHMLGRLAAIMRESGDHERARILIEERLTLDRAAQDKDTTAWSLGILAGVLWDMDHDPERALPLVTESIVLAREVRQPLLIAGNLILVGLIAQAQKDYQRAHAHYAESLTIWWDLSNRGMVAVVLGIFGQLAGLQGLPERAATLIAAGSPAESDPNPHILPEHHTIMGQEVSALRIQLGDAAFAARWSAGRAMTPEQAVAYALEKPGDGL